MIGRRGQAGWFRIAAGFSAAAALGAAYQAWSVSHPSADAVVYYAPPLGVAIGVGAALFAGASVLAMRRRAIAGLCLLLGYAIPAGTLYAQQGTIIPPSLLIVLSVVALIMATRRTAAYNDPAS
jgi:peptidoglycan/LPS O-acetylase OafA/YrhL